MDKMDGYKGAKTLTYEELWFRIYLPRLVAANCGTSCTMVFS
jgi:hypothetical protein